MAASKSWLGILALVALSLGVSRIRWTWVEVGALVPVAVLGFIVLMAHLAGQWAPARVTSRRR